MVGVGKGIVNKSTIVDATEAFRLRGMLKKGLWKRTWVNNDSIAFLKIAILLSAAKGVDSLIRVIIGSRAGAGDTRRGKLISDYSDLFN